MLFVFGGVHNQSTILNDIWYFNLSVLALNDTRHGWSRVSSYTPVPLDPVRNPMALSHTTGEGLLLSETSRQVWRWELPDLDNIDDSGFWTQSPIGWPQNWRINASFVSVGSGNLLLSGGMSVLASDQSLQTDGESLTSWWTTERIIEPLPPTPCPETCYGSDCDYW